MIQAHGGGNNTDTSFTATEDKAIDLGILGGAQLRSNWSSPNSSLASEPFVSSAVNGGILVVPIFAASGGVLSAVRVKYQGDGASGGVKLRLYKRLESGTTTSMTQFGSTQTMLSASTVSTTYTLASPQTIDADTCYYAEIESVVTGGTVTLYGAQAIFTSRKL